jgi:hypothetical protein
MEVDKLDIPYSRAINKNRLDFGVKQLKKVQLKIPDLPEVPLR